jgi:hypothetical protein
MLPLAPVPAAESESQMERIETLERQAQRLKAAGEGEKARQLMREAEELRAKTPREGRDRDLPGPEALEERRTDLKRKLKELQGDLKELRQAGRQDAAAKAEQQIGRIEEELARLSRPEGVVKRPDRPTPPERPDLARPQGPEWEKRRHHLELALDNLRAAGMPELADRIAAQAKSQPRELARPEAPLLRRAEAAREELQRMRAELQELRQMVRELHARMDELSRQRR